MQLEHRPGNVSLHHSDISIEVHRQPFGNITHRMLTVATLPNESRRRVQLVYLLVATIQNDHVTFDRSYQKV